MPNKQFKMKVIASRGPAFGAYISGSVKDGEAIIFLDVLLCLAVDLDPKEVMAEVLAHEVLHACQDVLGNELTETDIDKALSKIKGVEVCESEDESQMIASMVNTINEQGLRIKFLEDEMDLPAEDRFIKN